MMTVPIFHRQWGEGEPVVLIHGLFGSLENLGMISRLLKDDFAIYALDLPNHGRSAHTDTASIPAMADAVMAWMEAINLPKAHFLGHSLGGKVSMELALRDPSRVDKLVIADIAPVAYERRHDEVFGGFRAVDLDRIASRSDAEQAMAPLVALESTRSFLLKNLEKINNKWRWRIHLDVLERDYHHLIAANSAHLPPFARPTLFMKGEKSNYILPEHREHTLTLFPEASIKIIDNTEHWLHAEKPDIFAGIVKRFLVR